MEPIDPFALPVHEFFKKYAGESLTFNDLCVLQPCTIDFPVSNVNLKSRITRNITIKTPLVASPMEDVSESALAIAVALQGFPAIIHYNLEIEEQSEQVRLVKRFENGFVKDPITLSPRDQITRAMELQLSTGISTLPVVDGGKVVGLTKNDYSGRKHSQLAS